GAQSHHLHHRAPPVHGGTGGPHHRARWRPHRRERHARTAADAGRAVRAAASAAVLRLSASRAMRHSLTARWYQERPPPRALAPLGALYRGLMHWRRRAYAAGWLAREHPGRPVVVIGNLTVGGTGKTPLTIWLAHALGAQGLRVGIVSR